MKIWIAIVVIILSLTMAWVTFNKYDYSLKQTMGECTIDSDCVPATCCHPDSCVPDSKAPVCDGIFCTEVCAEGTMDCGAGSCKCINNACDAVFIETK